MTPLAPDLSAFLQTHLPGECGASRHTIAAYAHAFTLLLRFAAGRLKRTPSELAIEDLDVQMVRAFLEHIEEGRANSVRSRNARLAAIKSFFRFVEHRHAVCLEQAMMIRAHVFEAERLHGDDTTIPILAKGKCTTGRIWVYVRDDQPFAGPAPPAAVFYASSDRRGEHPQRHLAEFSGKWRGEHLPLNPARWRATHSALRLSSKR